MTFGFILSLGRTGAHRQSLPAFFRPPFAGSQTPFSGVRFPLVVKPLSQGFASPYDSLKQKSRALPTLY